MSRITAIGFLIFLFIGIASAVSSSDVNIMRSESRASSKKMGMVPKHADADDASTVASPEDGREESTDDQTENEDEEPEEHQGASLLEVGSEGELHEDDDFHQEEEDDEEPDEEDERQKGKGQGKGRRDQHQDVEDDDEGERDHDEKDDRHWATEVHYIPATVFREFQDIKREGKNVTVEHVLELISEEHLAKYPETEKMIATKMVDPPPHADMEIEEFIAKETPAGFIDMVLKGKVDASAPEGAEMTLAQFRASHAEHRDGEGQDEEDDQEDKDVHFIPVSTFDALVALYQNGTGVVSREAIDELISDERFKSLPDTELIVFVKIESLRDPLPELLNSTTPMAFLEKVIKGKDSVPPSKPITLGEIRGSQEDDRREEEGASEEEEGEGHPEEQGKDEAGDGEGKDGASDKKADGKQDDGASDKPADAAADPEIEKMAGQGDDNKDTESVTK